jgi:hypothetical protein
LVLSLDIDRVSLLAAFIIAPSPLVGEGIPGVSFVLSRVRDLFPSIGRNPSPVSNSLRSFEPPSPTRGEGKKQFAIGSG